MRSLVQATLSVAAVLVTWGTIGAAEPPEFTRRDRWLQENLLDAASSPDRHPPFSFVLDGKPSRDVLATWERTTERADLPRQRTRHTLTWTDPRTGLQIRCVVVTYADYPAVEWTAYFKNTGAHDTPLLERIQAIDSRWEREPGGEFVLKYQKGDTCAPDLYQPLEQTLTPNTHLQFAPQGGRGTNFAFPYYNLVLPDGGLFVVIGWPGQWASSFTRDADRGLQVVAGQELTHLMLRPGEEIRTPLVVLMFWEGKDVACAQNLWRRWMITHNLPRTADGRLPMPIMPGNTSLEFNEMCNANEENQKYFIDRYVEERVKIDFWWMDAGWYPCAGWPQTGTWEPDLQRFPRGLRAISDHARHRGIKTLVWFEPERVAGGTWLSNNHPEWLLGGTLLNLGNPDARHWLTDHVDRTLREQGIDLYRQDFNMDPLDFWRRNDAPDRQGMTENLHIQGYLAYWDALRQRHPNLVIDSCASGGRRNDLETMRRAVALHPTDYNYSHLAAKQAFHHSLFQWLPYFGSNTLPIDSVDAYAIRSGHAMSVVLGYDLRRTDLDCALLRKLTDEARLVAGYYYDDFYPLTPYSTSEEDWLAWQFHRAETGSGVVEAFRRPRNQSTTQSLKLQGLDPKAVYELKDLDQDSVTRAPGRILIEQGLSVTLPRRPQAATILYTRTEGVAAVIAGSRQECEQRESVAFSGADSQSPQGSIVDYRWRFGDGKTAQGATVEHVFEQPGRYTVKLTVTDRNSATDSTSFTLTVKPEDTAPPTVASVACGRSGQVSVVYSEPVEQTSAESVANYTVDGGVHVQAASLAADLTTVRLRVSPLTKSQSYTLVVKGVRDRARNPHLMTDPSQHALAYSGLYGWWKLDDGQGDVAKDSSGNEHHGILRGAQGGPRWTPSAQGTALRFDGRDALVETDTFLPDLVMPFSIALWVHPAATQVEHADLLGNHGEPFVGINLQQEGNQTNCFGFGFGDGQKWQGAGPVPLTADRWQHLTVVCDGEASLLYVDGELKAQGPGKGPLAANPNQNFKLGQGYHSGRYFHGLLRDVRIYDHALSRAEIAELAGKR
jgi:alpha-galactosidase